MCQECIKLQKMDRCYRQIGVYVPNFYSSTVEFVIDGRWFNKWRNTPSYNRILSYMIDHNLISEYEFTRITESDTVGMIINRRFNPETNESCEVSLA